MGLLSDAAVAGGEGGHALGGEFAGVVVKSGSKSGVSVGDRVFGIGKESFGGTVVTRGSLVSQLDESVSFETGAGLSVVYVTALYGLRDVGRLTSGETVLIHGGAGGVGVAAINVAIGLGARVIATAGSEEKREWLRKTFGLEHVF